MGDDEDGGRSLDSLASISEGAGLFLIGKGISNVFRFLTNIVLTRYLGTNLYGIYAYLNVVFSLFTVIARLGGSNSVLRYLPEYRENPRQRQAMLTLAYGTSVLASILVAVAIYFFAPLISAYTLDDPLFIDILRTTAIIIPFNTLSKITYAVFKGIERMDYNVAISSIIHPAFRLVFLGGGAVLGSALTGVAAGLIVTAVLTLLVALVALVKKTDLGTVVRPTREDAKRYYNFSLPLTFNQLGNFLYNRIDLLMVGFLLSGSEVGIYNVAVVISGVLVLPLTAFNQLFPTVASRLYHNDRNKELEQVYRSVTWIIFTVTLFPAIAMILYAQNILYVFGDQFTQGALVLVLFTIAQMMNCLVGPSGYLLMMSDRQYLTLFNQFSSGLLNAILNYVLILEYGFIGAAVATACVLIMVNLLRLGEVWYLERILPYDWSYLKPIIAGAIAATTMYLLSFIFEGFTILFVGSLFGGLAFVASLYLLGINERSLKVMKDAIPSGN
ncbi:flippase [Natrinema pallidum]|nr:flippase [Natrinema pallidum]